MPSSHGKPAKGKSSFRSADGERPGPSIAGAPSRPDKLTGSRHFETTTNASLTRRDFMGGALAGAAAMGLTDARADDSSSKLKTAVWTGDLKLTTRPQPDIPRTAKPNGLNIIVIVADTWRTDHLGCNGRTRVKTPHLDKFANQSVVFTNVSGEGLPTIPSRRVYHTGKSVLPEARWRPLVDSDVTFAEILGAHGFTTGFIADTYHYFKPDYNFHRGFDSWEWIRGQETDAWQSGPKADVDPRKHIPPHLWNPDYDRNIRQYLLNTHERQDELDYFCARSCQAAIDWLQRNADSKPFMLWVDMFDPHEPWDAPPRFQKMYRDEYPCERYVFGYGVKVKDLRPDDLAVIRDLYAAEVSFSDYCIGRLLTSIEGMGLMKHTVIVFASDHGTHLGEDGCVHKTPGLLNRCVTQIPLIIRHPDGKYAGKRVGGLVSAIDFMPTFLALVGIDDYKRVDGRNMWDLVEGKTAAIHDAVYSVFAQFGAIHNLQWHYFQNVFGDHRGKGPCLYDLKNDPQQTRNVLSQFPQMARELRHQLQSYLGIRIPPLA
jgi:arylsulfatase A-like enzyme